MAFIGACCKSLLCSPPVLKAVSGPSRVFYTRHALFVLLSCRAWFSWALLSPSLHMGRHLSAAGPLALMLRWSSKNSERPRQLQQTIMSSSWWFLRWHVDTHFFDIPSNSGHILQVDPFKQQTHLLLSVSSAWAWFSIVETFFRFPYIFHLEGSDIKYRYNYCMFKTLQASLVPTHRLSVKHLRWGVIDCLTSTWISMWQFDLSKSIYLLAVVWVSVYGQSLWIAFSCSFSDSSLSTLINFLYQCVAFG